MRREFAIILVVVLLILAVVAGLWGRRLVNRPGQVTPTASVQKESDSPERSIENQLTEAVRTLAALQKTATSAAMTSSGTPSAAGTVTPPATSAPPVAATPTRAVAETGVPVEVSTPGISSPTAAPAPTAITVLPVSAEASSEPVCSQDSQGNPVCYPASNVIDGETATAWREVLSKTPWVEVELPETFVVTQIALVSGYDKIDPYDQSDRWGQNYRPRRVRVSLDDVEEGEHELADTREWQEIDVQPQPARRIRLDILDGYPPLEGDRPYVAISEVRVIGRRP